MSDIEVDKFFEDYFDDAASRRTRSSEVPEMPPIENTLTATPDLYDHLTWQLHMSVSDELRLEILLQPLVPRPTLIDKTRVMTTALAGRSEPGIREPGSRERRA